MPQKSFNFQDLRQSRGRRAQAFTIPELLVVIGILILIAGILLLAVSDARQRAAITRQKADFQAIATALEAYAHDFKGYYPRSGLNNQGRPNGDRVLAWALIGPLDDDGHPGPGFRATPTGIIRQPYLSLDSFKVAHVQPTGQTKPIDNTTRSADLCILDVFGKPIEYYPRRDKDLPAPATLLFRVGTGNPARTMYDALDGPFTTIPQRRDGNHDLAGTLRTVLGDRNGNNQIDAGEQLRYSGPFLLVSAGPDELLMFPDPTGNATALKNADDIYNFE